MLFPYTLLWHIAESPKSVKYRLTECQLMRSSTPQALLERLVTGERCEEKGCYELAIWLVSFNDGANHWCSKHTRMNMRDVNHWSDLLKAGLGA